MVQAVITWKNVCDKKVTVLLLALLCLCLSAFAQAPRAVSVPSAKTLELEDGRVLRLAAIQAPNTARQRDETHAPLALDAQAELQRLAQGQRLRIAPLGKPDRHGRIVAFVYDEQGRLLQAEMLRAGMGWVYSFPDSRAMAAPLLAAEAEAEAAGHGVWGRAEYAVLTPENAEEHIGEFRLVQGVLRKVAFTEKRIYLNFGEDYKTDFTLSIERKNFKHFDEAWLESLTGKTLRARGWLFRMNGAAMELTHAEQIELRD